MNQKILKPIEHYNFYIKKLYSTRPLRNEWREHGAPVSKIGNCMGTFEAYDKITDDKDMSYQGFYNYYLQHEKSLDEFNELTKEIMKVFLGVNLKYRLNELYSFENIFDLIILHTIIDTFAGGMAEKKVKYYLQNKGCEVTKDETIDRTYHIDFIITNPKTNAISAVQVKPITFIFGILKNKKDIVLDEFSVFKSFEKFKKDEKLNPKNVSNLYFIFYKINDKGQLVFLSYAKNPFFKINSKEDLDSVDWNKIANDKTKWKTL